MAKIVSFSNQKGGVGKTTTCMNMAAYLASFGKKTLLIDMDSQGNATTGLGVVKSTLKKSIYDILVKDATIQECMLEMELKNLFLIPSNIELAGAEVELVYKNNREKLLKMALDVVKDKFDYIFIDCPPSLGLVTINALTAADSVIIPIQSEFFALEGLTQLMNSIQLVQKHLNQNLKLEGVILTMYSSAATISNEISLEIKKYFGKKLFEIVVPRNIRLVEAASHGKPIVEFDPTAKSMGAKAYKALTEEFLWRETNLKD